MYIMEMYGRLLLLSTLIGCISASTSINSTPNDDGTHVMSLTMCLAQLSQMNEVKTLRRANEDPVPIESGLKKMKCSVTNRMYRTPNGLCNNIRRPSLGQANDRFQRYLRPVYQDGVGAPKINSVDRTCRWQFSNSGGWWGRWYRRKIRICVTHLLPSARTVSTCIHPSKNVNSHHTVMVMQWGQFMDHDMTATAIEQPKDAKECCRYNMKPGKLHPDSYKSNKSCFPITIDILPDRFSNCLPFVRSRAVNPRFSHWRPREQQNLLTSFVDASNVYGSSEKLQKKLRSTKGRMATSAGNLLPKGEDGDCRRDNATHCFQAGDERVHVFPGLTALHTALVRYHNIIVDDLRKHNPAWTDERLFQETKKIISALIQRVTYLQYLPEILSPQTIKKYRLDEGKYRYNIRINPRIASSFSTAAFRYGHSLIPDFLVIDGNQVKSRELFNNPQFIFSSLKSVVENILSNPAQMSDRFLSDEITNHLFEKREGPFDLAAFNIQRGRDHGLPSYNSFRRLCWLPKIKSFDDRNLGSGGQVLKSVYRHVDDIDLFAGGMVEPVSPKSSLGPVFDCLIGRQFRDLKFGDSFWYETSDKRRGFTSAQLSSLKNVTLSNILCEVFNLKKIQRNPFRVVSNGNKLVKCSQLKKMNLSPWYEH